MRIKLLIILFVVFLSTYVGEIKAEEICYYSNYQEFKKCKKGKQKYLPKYPINNFHSEQYAMGPRITNAAQSLLGNVYQVIDLQAFSDKKLKITIGQKSVGLFGLTYGRPWITKNTYFINPQNIFFFENKNIQGFYPGKEYRFKYIDEYGEVNSIKFEALIINRKKRTIYDILGNYLRYASGLEIGESQSVQAKREQILKDNEKFLNITKSIILSQNDPINNCFLANESKFPELIQRYKKLYKTINPLRAKLDLPPSSDLIPICS